MNKRIKSLVLAVIMAITLIAVSVPVFASETLLKITADKTDVIPGDIITFTITLGPVSDLGSMQMSLDIPNGLTYVPDSTKLADGLKNTLGFDSLDWTEVSKMINGYGSNGDYECSEDTPIATFQCIVNDDYFGTVTMGLTRLEFYSTETWEDHTSEYQVVSPSIKVHDWITPPSFSWEPTDDGYSANAIFEDRASEDTYVLAANVTSAVTKEPDCVNPGTRTYTATVTGPDNNEYMETKEVDIDAFGHTAVTDAAVPSTCTETGLTEGSHCSVCGEVLVAQEKTEELGHDYNAVVTAPTCTAQGFTTHTCSRCGDSYIDSYVDALGHTAVTDAAVPATCTETGLTEGSHCSVCGEVLVAQEKTEELGHDYNAVVTAPTCTAQGFTTHTCSRCGDSYIDSYVDALGHTAVTDAAVPATCTETGLTEGSHCSVCGEVLVAQEKTEELGHDYNAVVTAPTCTAQGFTTHTCSRCGDSYIDSYVDALGHTAVTDAAVPATCTETGLTEGSHCSVCGEVLVAQEIVEATGHNWGSPSFEWATDFSSVTVTRICANDSSHKETETVQPTSEITKEPTVTEAGERTYTAEVTFDGETFTDTKTEVIPALGVTVSGTFKSFKSNSDAITIALYAEGEETAAYSVDSNGNASGTVAPIIVTGDYSIEKVAPGSYTVVVTKKDHVTREYSLTVGNENVTLDVEIWLLGDVTGDGKVTTVDAARANSHAQGKSLLEGYPLKCGDVVGNDGTITTVDAARINSHAQGKSLLWEY